MKLCDKCKAELEENEDNLIKYTTIELYGQKLDMCNDCSLQTFKFITGKAPELVDGADALFD